MFRPYVTAITAGKGRLDRFVRTQRFHARNAAKTGRQHVAPSVPRVSDPEWVAVCRLEDLDVERGVAVLVHGRGVALFRTDHDEVRAVSNRDPFSRAGVLARGLVGTRGDVLCVASPLHRQAFDLATGVCLDDPAVRISTYEARVLDGIVEIGPRRVT